MHDKPLIAIEGHRRHLEKRCLLSILDPHQGDYHTLLNQLSRRRSLSIVNVKQPQKRPNHGTD